MESRINQLLSIFIGWDNFEAEYILLRHIDRVSIKISVLLSFGRRFLPESAKKDFEELMVLVVKANKQRNWVIHDQWDSFHYSSDRVIGGSATKVRLRKDREFPSMHMFSRDDITRFANDCYDVTQYIIRFHRKHYDAIVEMIVASQHTLLSAHPLKNPSLGRTKKRPPRRGSSRR